MNKLPVYLALSTFLMIGCSDSNTYTIENGVRLNKRTGEMIAISQDSYKLIEEFKVDKKESPIKVFDNMEIPIIENDKNATVKLIAKYKNGSLLYKAVLEISDLGINNHEFIKKNVGSSITLNFKDEDGFSVGPTIELSASNAISNHSAKPGDISITWEGKLPITSPDYVSIKNPYPMWTRFSK